MKRILYFLFVILFATNTFGQNKNQFSITSNPILQNMSSTGVEVFWQVSTFGTGWVEYNEPGKTPLKAFNYKWGMKDISQGIQSVKIEGLKPGTTYSYRTVSVEVIHVEAYKVIYGDTVYSNNYKFSTPSQKEEEFSFLAFNDLHNNPQFIEDVVKRENDFKFAVFNGDILTDLNDEKEFGVKIFSPLSNYFAAEKPAYFIRGNHETRGGAARGLYKYLAMPDGKFYYTFKRGSTYFIMLDCGEDKPDNNKNYFDLADYDNYRSIETEWLKNVVKSKDFKNAKNRIVCIHMPVKLNPGPDSEGVHGMHDCSIKFAPVLNKAGIDLLLAGHTHKFEIIKPGKETNKFPVVVGGRNYDPKTIEKTTYTKVTVSGNKITAELKHIDGSLIEKIEIKK